MHRQRACRSPCLSSLTWRDLAARTYHEVVDDDVFGLAAQLSYYFFLALFPAILFGLALASFFPLGTLTDDLTRLLGPVVSPEVLTLIQDQMRRLANAESGGLLTFGVLGALWSSSAALVSIVGALNRAYDIEESRPWWKVRLLAMGLTIGLAVFILAALTLVLAGPSIATYLDEHLGMGSALKWTWLILQWPVALGLVALGLGLLFYFGPDAEQDWAWITPGALFGSVLWLLVSLRDQALRRELLRLQRRLRQRRRRHGRAAVAVRVEHRRPHRGGAQLGNRACVSARQGGRAEDARRDGACSEPRRHGWPKNVHRPSPRARRPRRGLRRPPRRPRSRPLVQRSAPSRRP